MYMNRNATVLLSGLFEKGRVGALASAALEDHCDVYAARSEKEKRNNYGFGCAIHHATHNRRAVLSKLLSVWSLAVVYRTRLLSRGRHTTFSGFTQLYESIQLVNFLSLRYRLHSCGREGEGKHLCAIHDDFS